MKLKERDKACQEPICCSVWQWLIPPVILSLLTAVTYYPSLSYPFQFDDLANIVKYFNIRHNTFGSLCFRSTRWISLWLNTIYYKFAQFQPYVYRLGNMLGHIVTGILIFFMVLVALKRLSRTSFFGRYAFILAALTSGLFLLHPVQTQTVSYVIQGQQEGLAGLFMIAMVLIFLWYAGAKTTLSRLFFLILLLTTTAFACGTKEIAIIAPLLVMISDWFFVAQGSWQSFRQRLWIHGALIIMVFGNYLYFYRPHYFMSILSFTMETQSNIGNQLTDMPAQKITAWGYFISQFKVILHYIWIFIWPFNISVDYDWKLSRGFFAPDCLIPLLILIMVAVWLLGRFRRNSSDTIVFCFLWFFITILPRSSIIPSTELMVDYKTYTGSVGIFLLLSAGIVWLLCTLRDWWVARVSGRKEQERMNFWCLNGWPVFIIAIILLVPVAFATYQRNKIWRSAEEFWFDIIQHAPGKARAYNNYGVSLTERGQYEEAIPHFKKAMAMDRAYPDPCNNLAVAYASINQIDLAIEAMRYGIQMQPYYPEGYNNLASFLLSKGEFEAAEKALRQALELRPHYGKAYYNLGRMYFALGKQEQGLENFKNACTKADLDNEMGFSTYGSACLMAGRWEEAVDAFINSLKSNPQSSTSLFNLSYAYYMLRDYERCLELYKKYLQLCPSDPRGYFNLGETHFALKNYEDAFNMYQKTIDLGDNIGEAYVRQAVCLERLGKLDAAIDLLNKALTFKLREDIQQGAMQLLNQYRQMQYLRGGVHR